MYAAYVYILRCADGSYYVGSARGSLERRLEEHSAGMNCRYTKSRRPVTLVWSQAFQQITDAIAAERQIKGWSRAKKEALIILVLRQAQDEDDRVCCHRTERL
jgi:putative endonuclease